MLIHLGKRHAIMAAIGHQAGKQGIWRKTWFKQELFAQDHQKFLEYSILRQRIPKTHKERNIMKHQNRKSMLTVGKKDYHMHVKLLSVKRSSKDSGGKKWWLNKVIFLLWNTYIKTAGMGDVHYGKTVKAVENRETLHENYKHFQKVAKSGTSVFSSVFWS